MQYRFAGALSQIVMFGQGFSASSGRSSVTRTPNLRIQGTASSRLPWQRRPRAAPQASARPRWQRLSRAIALVMINRNREYEVERLVENTQAKVEQLVENMDAKTPQFTGAPFWMKVGGEGDRAADAAIRRLSETHLRRRSAERQVTPEGKRERLSRGDMKWLDLKRDLRMPHLSNRLFSRLEWCQGKLQAIAAAVK
jgi:hypothetical protein